MGNINATPNIPKLPRPNRAIIDAAVKPATPDLVLIKEDELPIDIVTELLFEDIGSIEILTVARTDTINGRNVSYSLLPRLSDLADANRPTNIFILSGTLDEFLNSFTIPLSDKIPEQGTGPLRLYVGPENSFGCSGFPVLNYRTDAVVQCFDTFQEAQNYIVSLNLRRDFVYSEPGTGNIVIDVINLDSEDDLVQVEILSGATVESDTIY